ncbi:uncharacterized protein PAN0_011c4316 [Moesziomyces antarcticus]|uniref:Uncharacterized protein n=2 Tax=Pseudozyma antarctica TaxID=84753 RepID=A0A5C3FRR1_PSEA2|nr:uncharacterized protein PAN0_011c4316 [Moesziomyces antarcticus]GAK66094.1 hypothetical protein PAN0_011c4316 [Moesziomyces antarcticus]SPO46870.1 uncharacterized protein PSANT_04556 [Moesziomyces antarcticus]
MNSTPQGPARPTLQPQQSPAVGLSTAQVPVFHNFIPDALDSRIRDLEQNVIRQANWQALYLDCKNELAACKTKNEELEKKMDKLALELTTHKENVHKDFSFVTYHMNGAMHRLAQVEDRLSKAHHQLNERLTHTVEQQAAQADSFQDRYVGPLFAALHQLLPGGIVAGRSDETIQTDVLQSSIPRASLSVSEKDVTENRDTSLTPSTVQQVDSTLPPPQLPGSTADQGMAPVAPSEATAERPKTSMSSMDTAPVAHPGIDAVGVKLPTEPPSNLLIPAQAAADSVATSNASSSSEFKASSSREVQQLATPQAVESPCAISASPESSSGKKRKRTPSVEHTRTQVARRSAQSSIKSAGIAPESSGSVPSFKTAQATIPAPLSASSATHHVEISNSNVAAMVDSDAVRWNERPSSTPKGLATSQQHLLGHSTVPTELQEGSTMAQSGLEPSDSPAVRNSWTVANTVGAAKSSTQASLVPNARNSSAQMPSKERLSPREAQRRVKELTAPRSASRAGNTARLDQVAKSGASSLPERSSTAESSVARGAPSTMLLASNGSRNSAPAQTPAMSASPPPPRPSTSAGGTSRHPSSLEKDQAGMAAAHSRLGPSDAFIAPRMSTCDVGINEARASSIESLPRNGTRQRSQSQASPPSSPDVPLSSRAPSTDASWPRPSSPRPQASTAAVPPEPSPSDEAAPTTGIATARQSKEPDVHPPGLAASSSNSASGVVDPATEGSRRPSTANRSVLTADPRRKALLPSQSANLSGLSTSPQPAAPIKPAVPLKHALPSKPLFSTDQLTRAQPETSRSASALEAPTDPPVQNVKLEQDAVVPSSAQQTERAESSLPPSSTSNSGHGRDNVDIRSHVEREVRTSSIAATSRTPMGPPSRPTSVNGLNRTSSGPKPASQATQESSQASSAPLDKDLAAVQVEARSDLETPSSAESRQPPPRAAVEKQQTGRHFSGSADDQRQDERCSDQNRQVEHYARPDRSETQTVARQHQSRVERLASTEKVWTGREDRDTFYLVAFLGRLDRPTALLVTEDSQITDSLISEDLADELLRVGGASRLGTDEPNSWLEVDLSWPYNTNMQQKRSGGNRRWFRARLCRFLIVPREYMKVGICLGRRGLDDLKLSIVLERGQRPSLAVAGPYGQGSKLRALPGYELKQPSLGPFRRLCYLARLAIEHSDRLEAEYANERGSSDVRRSDSARNSLSGSNASHSHLEPLAWGRDTLQPESSIEAESSLERDRISRELGERRDREHDAPHLSTPLANATSLRASTTRDESVDRNSSEIIAEGRKTPALDTGSPLTPLSQASEEEEEEEEEEDELMDETDSEHRSAPETLEDLTEDQRRAIIERTQRLLQDQKGGREQAGFYGNAPPSGLQLMGSSQRFRNLGDATQ